VASTPGNPWQPGSPGILPPPHKPFRVSRKPLLALAAIVVVLIAIGAVAAGQHLHFGSSPVKSVYTGSDVRVAYTKGQTAKFQVHQIMLGAVAIENQGRRDVRSDLTGTETVTVLSLDPNGVATIEVRIEGLTGTVDGAPFSLKAPSVYQLQVTPEGRIVAGGGVAQTGGPASDSVPGSDQPSAILTTQRVKPGATWAAEYDRPNPLGAGSIHVTAQSAYLRNETVNGLNTAVIQTQAGAPLDIRIDLRKLGEMAGDKNIATEPPGSNIHYTGKVKYDISSWIDSAGHGLVRSTDVETFDLTMTFEGLRPGEFMGPMYFAGRQTTTVEAIK
jgi:hypothetical protein